MSRSGKKRTSIQRVARGCPGWVVKLVRLIPEEGRLASGDALSRYHIKNGSFGKVLCFLVLYPVNDLADKDTYSAIKGVAAKLVGIDTRAMP
jgi:hypothetical protein